MKRRKFLKAMAAGYLASNLNGPENAAGQRRPYPELTWKREVPIRWQADVAVIGGGIAGVCAACAAAEAGADVVLVERFAVCGGDLTSGGVANFCGRMDGNGQVFDEIVADLKRWDSIGHPRAAIFDHEVLAVVLQELLLRHGVKLLLHTRFADVHVIDDRIAACILVGFSGPEAVAAHQFVDCTGGGDVARRAQCEVMVAPEPLPMSMMYFVREGHDAGPSMPEDWPVTGQPLPRRSIWPNGPGEKANKQWLFGYSSIDTETMTSAEIAVRRTVMERHAADLASGKNWRYDHCSPIVGIREGCRIVGDYVLDVQDLIDGRSFDDGVAVGTYQLDNHIPGAPMAYDQVPPYQIPLRSLIARDMKNLLMAGRCFSCDQLALSSARVSTTGSMMGQAAGLSAALAAEENCDVRAVDPERVRKALRQRGARLDV